MIILDHEQGTEEWFAARLGKPSASNFSKLITATGKPSSSLVHAYTPTKEYFKKYHDQIAAEVLDDNTRSRTRH